MFLVALMKGIEYVSLTRTINTAIIALWLTGDLFIVQDLFP
jgi:hypothetical protein